MCYIPNIPINDIINLAIVIIDVELCIHFEVSIYWEDNRNVELSPLYYSYVHNIHI